MSREMKAAVYIAPNEIAIRESSMPEVKEGWCTVKVAYCGVCGTDLNIYGGGHPRAEAPLIMGHELSGHVFGHPRFADGAAVTMVPLLVCGKCKPCMEGTPHVCESLKLIGIDRDGGMAEYVSVPNESIIALPESISLKVGALVEPFAVAVHAVRESRFKSGDAVTVFGAGPIGLCVALVLKYFGAAEVQVVEVNEYRSELARELGFKVMNPVTDDIKKNEIVYDCAAHPSVAELLVEVTHVRGEIILVGTYKEPTPLDLQNVNFKELTVKGSRVYTNKDFEIASDLLSKHEEVLKLITNEGTIEDADHLFKELIRGGDMVKAVISFQS